MVLFDPQMYSIQHFWQLFTCQHILARIYGQYLQINCLISEHSKTTKRHERKPIN